MQVKKRNGQLEELHYEKINKVLNWAVMDISDVNSSDVAMNAKLQLYDGISTDSIHEVLINSAVELISEENPNYQYVASSLLNYLLRKRLYNSQNDLPSLYELVKKNIKLGFYNSEFLDLYTEEEFNAINNFIKHDRDYLLTYSGLQQVIDKYLVKDRFNNQVFETPQYMWILISMYLFKHYPKDKRLKQVKSFYDDISKLKLNLSTPILSGVRTPMTQFSSCVLVEVGDNLDSIFASVQAVGKYTARKAGIGLHLGNIRALGDKIRNGEVIHTGVVPFTKVFESTVKSCQQAGLRGGGATTYFPIWHKEIENIVVLKNNRGTEDNRVRKLDYGIQINKLFYNRLIKKQNITLFSPHDVPSLKEAFYSGNNELFEKIYTELEKDTSISKKTIPATELFNSIAKERLETGRIYIMNIDNVNNNGSFSIPVNMSNLCLRGDCNIYYKKNDDSNDLVKMVELHEFNTLFNQNTGDKYYVLSNNIETNELEFSLVTNSFLTGETNDLIEIVNCFYDENNVLKMLSDPIYSTPEHKIYTRNRGYVMAKDLLEDDLLDDCENNIQTTITKIRKIYSEEKIPVYDITVEKNHNFYANGILVHNCTEITLPTAPIQHIDDPDGEIALCVLSNINLAHVKEFTDLRELCYNAVRALDAIIDIQDYPIAAAKKMLKRRSIGIGVTNLAYFLAKRNLKYGSDETLLLLDELFEHFAYYLTEASVQLAKEFGRCEYFEDTKYAKGLLPIDRYNKKVDSLTQNRPLSLDWDSLRKDVLTYGIRNSTLSTNPPTESCQKSDTQIHTKNGIKSFEEIFTEQGFDIKKIEEENLIGWYHFDSPIEILTKDGTYQDSDKFYYNGKKETYKIEFEDGNYYEMTANHRLLVNRNNEEIWVRADELEENDDVVNIINISKGLITKITKQTELSPTYDIEVQNAHHYILSNGCVSHNSSLVSNSTNGIEPIRSLITAKKSKQGVLKVVAPESNKLKNKYELAFDVSNLAINKTVSVIQKYMDQAISVNHYYSPKKYENGNIPISVIIGDILNFYQYGGKCLYYANTDNNKNSAENEVNKELEYIVSNDDTSCIDGACAI